jgi:hypothetical protein
MSTPEIVHGDLLDQPVEVIVNARNRNIIPWWLLLQQCMLEAARDEPFGGRMSIVRFARG